MAPPGLLVAVEQGRLVCLEEDDAGRQAVDVEGVDDREQLVEVLAAAHVGDHGGALYAAAFVAEELPQGADQTRGQVVDAEVAAVLEGGDRLRLARTRVAGDHNHLNALLSHQLGSGFRARPRPRLCCRASRSLPGPI
jgi:hypothetical protein